MLCLEPLQAPTSIPSPTQHVGTTHVDTCRRETQVGNGHHSRTTKGMDRVYVLGNRGLKDEGVDGDTHTHATRSTRSCDTDPTQSIDWARDSNKPREAVQVAERIRRSLMWRARFKQVPCPYLTPSQSQDIDPRLRDRDVRFLAASLHLKTYTGAVHSLMSLGGPPSLRIGGKDIQLPSRHTTTEEEIELGMKTMVSCERCALFAPARPSMLFVDTSQTSDTFQHSCVNANDGHVYLLACTNGHNKWGTAPRSLPRSMLFQSEAQKYGKSTMHRPLLKHMCRACGSRDTLPLSE